MLAADLDEIRSLGAQLRIKANELAGIAAPVRSNADAVVMPDAGIDDLLGRISTTLEGSVARHSSAVSALADGVLSSAASYEAVQEEFSRQLGLLTEGLAQ